MNLKKQNYIAAASLATLLWCASTAQGQYSGSNQTNTFNNASNNWIGAYSVGSNFFNDALIISNGGKLTNGYAYLGYNAGDNNNGAQVSGFGSLWFTTNDLMVGVSGSFNSMTVASSGKVLNATGYLGSNSTSVGNSVLVTDPGSVWGNKTNLYVGYLGSSNSLTVANGGFVTNVIGVIGNGAGANNNAVTVTGTGSFWTNRADLAVGYAGSFNNLIITNGGKVMNNNGWIGSNATASANSVLVTDVGSIWTNRTNLAVGYAGTGNALTVTNGGKVYDAIGYIGQAASGSNNAVTVTGSGSVWSNRSEIHIGDSGAFNTLMVTNGGAVFNNGTGYIGNIASATNNAVTVTGAGSVWSNVSSTLYVGNAGAFNTLSIAKGGTVTDNTGTLGQGANASNNTVTVTDTGSLWGNSGGGLNVGFSGSYNTLIVSNGGQVISFGQVNIGVTSVASNNAVKVTGAGSVMTNRADLYVGNTAGFGGLLTVANGGTVYNNTGHIGGGGGGQLANSNAVLVTGAGSAWYNFGTLYVGEQCVGNSLTVNNGGTVSNTSFGYVGGPYLASSNNTALVTGPGSVWNNGTNLYIGNAGPGNALTIANGGTVTVGGSLTVSANAGAANNAVNLTGGQLNVPTGVINVGPAGSAQLNLSGGSAFAQQLFATNGGNSAVNFTAGLLDVGAATVINGSTFMVGDGAHAATLNLRGGVSSFANGLVIAQNAFLTGSATVSNGDVLIQDGGTLAPGNGGTPGVFSFSNNLTLAGTMDIKLQNAAGPLGTGDFVNVGGVLDVSGGELDFFASDTPTNAVYVFCQYGSLLGTLAEVDDVPAGYALDTAYNGDELALVAVPEPVSLGLLVFVGGGLLVWRRRRRWSA